MTRKPNKLQRWSTATKILLTLDNTFSGQLPLSTLATITEAYDESLRTMVDVSIHTSDGIEYATIAESGRKRVAEWKRRFKKDLPSMAKIIGVKNYENNYNRTGEPTTCWDEATRPQDREFLEAEGKRRPGRPRKVMT